MEKEGKPEKYVLTKTLLVTGVVSAFSTRTPFFQILTQREDKQDE